MALDVGLDIIPLGMVANPALLGLANAFPLPWPPSPMSRSASPSSHPASSARDHRCCGSS
ncbi:MAG: hypothetical protein ACRBM6_35935 [Geminicoccales bacterium]